MCNSIKLVLRKNSPPWKDTTPWKKKMMRPWLRMNNYFKILLHQSCRENLQLISFEQNSSQKYTHDPNTFLFAEVSHIQTCTCWKYYNFKRFCYVCRRTGKWWTSEIDMKLVILYQQSWDDSIVDFRTCIGGRMLINAGGLFKSIEENGIGR